EPAGARRRRARGQGALRRLLELLRLPGCARARPQRATRPGALRLRAAALQPALSPGRARALSVLRGGRAGGDPVQPDRGRPALRQASSRSRSAGGHALHAPDRRRALSRPLLARAGAGDPRGAAPARGRSRHVDGATGRRLGARQSSRHRRSSAPVVPSSSTTPWPPSTRASTRASRRAWTTSRASTAGATTSDKETHMPRVAILDAYQNVAGRRADWASLPAGTDVVVFSDHLSDPDAVAKRLADFDTVVAMRERTPFPRALLERLPKLKLLVT